MKYPNIELERIKTDLSKTKFVKNVGVTLQTYKNWQASGNIPSSKIVQMSELFGCTTDHLLGIDKININKTG